MGTTVPAAVWRTMSSEKTSRGLAVAWTLPQRRMPFGQGWRALVSQCRKPRARKPETMRRSPLRATTWAGRRSLRGRWASLRWEQAARSVCQAGVMPFPAALPARARTPRRPRSSTVDSWTSQPMRRPSAPSRTDAPYPMVRCSSAVKNRRMHEIELSDGIITLSPLRMDDVEAHLTGED